MFVGSYFTVLQDERDSNTVCCFVVSFFIFICNQDPFSMEVNRGPHGTKDNPRKVPSMFEERIVGCICEFQQAEAKTELG